MQVLNRHERNEAPPRQRSSEIGLGQIVVAVIDHTQTIRHWQIMADPRILRGEFPDANGHLRMTLATRTDVEWSLTLPGGIDAAEIRVLSPSWESGELTLSPLASLKLEARDRQ